MQCAISIQNGMFDGEEGGDPATVDAVGFEEAPNEIGVETLRVELGRDGVGSSETLEGISDI